MEVGFNNEIEIIFFYYFFLFSFAAGLDGRWAGVVWSEQQSTSHSHQSMGYINFYILSRVKQFFIFTIPLSMAMLLLACHVSRTEDNYFNYLLNVYVRKALLL